MATDDERREVAERLRSANEHSCSPDCELCYALDGSYECTGNGCAGCRRDAFDRLADLIDPGCDDGRYEGVHTARPVDRGALLALAEGLECRADELIRAAQHARFSGLGPTMDRAKHDASELRGIARRIREAFGEGA